MIQVQELNTCPTSWHDEFLRTLFLGIKENHDYIHHVIHSHKEMTLLKASFHHTVYEYGRRFLDMYNILDSTPYYYIKYLLDTNPKNIIDIGCGDNVFKKSFPTLITGLDNNPECCMRAPDILENFDKNFVQTNQQCYDGVISINCIHFSPIHTIAERLGWVAQLLTPGSRAFVSFNIETWLMFTRKSEINSIFGKIPQWEAVVNYINDQIISTKLNFLVVDWPILQISDHSTIRDDYNGNIRLVFSV